MRRKNCTKERMKEYISESLLLLMGGKPYADITIGEITEKAGVNRSTYYRNFLSKEEVVKFYLSQMMNRYLGEYEALGEKSFGAYLHTLFAHFYQYKKELLLLYKNGLSYLLLEVLRQFFQQRQLQKFSCPKEQFRLFYHIGGIYNFFILWLTHGMQETPEELTQIAVEMFPADKQPVLFK